MNAAQIVRSAGLVALFQTSGEPLTFRGGTITGIVNRKPERQDAQKTHDFDDRAASTIELLLADVTGPPIVGEYIIDEAADAHRIDKIPRKTDLTWRLDCIVTPTDEEGS